MRSQKLTMYIMVGLVLGIACGYVLNAFLPDPQTAARVAGYVSLLSDIFLRLIKMIIGPLVFCTLVAGIAKMGSPEALGRIGAKALGWFICASVVSLLIGLVMVNLFAPGVGLNLPLPDAGTATNLKTSSLSLKDFVTHLVPKSFFEAMANNEILQIVVFSVFFGVAALAVPGTEPLVKAIDKLGHIVLRITNYVMLFAPIAVFAAITAIITTQGVGVLVTYGTLLARVLLLLRRAVARAVRGRSLFPGRRHDQAGQAGPRPDPACVQHRQQRSRLPSAGGAAGELPDQQEDRRLRPAAWVTRSTSTAR